MMLQASVLLLLLAVQTANQQAENPHPANLHQEGQADRAYFAYQRPLNIAAASGQTCAVLDPAILTHSAPGMPDLRLYSGAQQISYAIRTSSPPQPRQELAVILNLGIRAGNVTFDAEMPEGKYSTIRMDVTARNFVTTVDVTGSEAPTAAGPQTKLGTYTIFDLTGEKLDRSTVLHLPESNFRYLHFIVHAPIQPQQIQPQQIGGITITGEPLESVVYPTILETNAVTQQAHQSVFTVTIPANVPVDRIEFVPAATPANFSRGVGVTWRSQISAAANTSRNDSARFPMLEKGIIRRIHSIHNGHRIDSELFTLDPGYATDAVPTRMTITILNGDDEPVSIRAVRLQMRERRICFDAAPGAGYTLYYGDSQLPAPQYDYASLFQMEEHPALATLGTEQANPLFQPRPDRRPLTERHPAWLWIELLAVIAILGLVAVRTARRVRP